MEHLTQAQKTTVTKSSSDRLRLHLLKAGYSEEIVLGWSREELMEKYADVLLKGPLEAVEPVLVMNPEVAKARFEHEEKMKQLEMDMRKTELLVEKEKMAQQMSLEQEKLALERHKLQMKALNRT